LQEPAEASGGKYQTYTLKEIIHGATYPLFAIDYDAGNNTFYTKSQSIYNSRRGAINCAPTEKYFFEHIRVGLEEGRDTPLPVALNQENIHQQQFRLTLGLNS
jgi:hypothetical protein